MGIRKTWRGNILLKQMFRIKIKDIPTFGNENHEKMLYNLCIKSAYKNKHIRNNVSWNPKDKTEVGKSGKYKIKLMNTIKIIAAKVEGLLDNAKANMWLL